MSTQDRWTALWQRLGASGDGRSICDDLLARYSEPQRKYHNLAHLQHCLAELDEVRQLASAPDVIELALWFHDAIYDTRRKDSEEQSAAMAREAIEIAKLPGELAQRVADLILATRHDAIPTDADAQLLVDIDLAILGQPEPGFDAYEADVRQEYDWVPTPVFNAARGQVLRSFLDRPTIYTTPHFRAKYEAQARSNLMRSLARH